MRRAIISLILVSVIALCVAIDIAPTALSADYSSLRQYYADNPQPALSNQSLVFDQGGHVIQVVTGKPGEATVRPAAGATIVPNLQVTNIGGAPAIAPVSTAVPTAQNVTANVTKNATAIPPVATATPTKTQSPGFGIAIVAIGMLAAIFYIRSKK